MNRRLARVLRGFVLLIALSACRLATGTPLSPAAPAAPPGSVATPVGFEFSDFYFTELGDGKVAINACTQGSDVGTTIRVRINTDPRGTDQGQWVAPETNAEVEVTCFSAENRPIWDTSDWAPGSYRVLAEAKKPSDPNWENPAWVYLAYTVESGKNGHK